MFFLSTMVMASISLAASLIDGTGRWQHNIAQCWARMVLALAGVKVSMSGLENLTPGAAYVFCSNHLSLMDTPLMFGCVPWQFRTLAKNSLFRIPFLGWHLRRAGHLPIPRDGRPSIRSITEAARRLTNGVSILIFPEGGRSEDGQMGEFLAGAAFIAIRGRVPVVPMCILGTREIHRTGSLVVRPGRVILRIGAPIAAQGITRNAARRLLAEMRERVGVLLESASGSAPIV